MFGMAKMKPGLEGYYEKTIAHGADDYYAEAGEAPGMWAGAGITGAGISGEVTAAQLATLFGQGLHPITGAKLGQRFSKRSISGHSISLSAPKSVSVLWALGGDDIATQVREAHDAAVTAALGYLDEHIAFSRIGRGGPLQVDTDGLIAAVYVHRTSRALDPQLHSHLLVANKVVCPDGKWRAIDGDALFHSQKSCGAVYRAALRAELTGRLGVAWTPIDEEGLTDIAGVPERLLDHFSTRAREVDEAALDREDYLEQQKGRPLTKRERAGVRQAAALSTRSAKPLKGLTTAELHDKWSARAASIGCDASTWIRRVLGRPPTPILLAPPVHVEEVVRAAEAKKSTFSRQDLTIEVAARLTTTGLTANQAANAIEADVDRAVAHLDIVTLDPPLLTTPPPGMVRADGLPLERRHHAARFTTRQTLTAEATVLDLAQATGAPALDRFAVSVACGASGLGDDQTTAVHRVCEADTQLVCLVGPAGTGKSRSVQAIAAACAAAGIPVTGLALSAAAARVLSLEAGITTETIAKHLHTGEGLPARGVLVVDEAGLVPTHTLARLADQVRASGSKLVLVGDPNQLGAVGAGGLFPLLAADTAALDTVHRFANPWEAAASLKLRTGDPSCANEYLAHDRITASDDPIGDALEQWTATRADGADVLVVAVDRATVDDFNHAAQQLRIAAGDVTDVRNGFGVGDDVITLRNQRHTHTSAKAWVANGDRWTITAINGNGAVALVSRDGKGAVTLDARYAAEHLALGYATTIHKAQGRTVDRCIALLPANATREQAYVALTRGRDTNHAHLIPAGTLDDHQAPAAPPDPADAFRAIVARTTTEITATEALRTSFANADNLAVLVPLRAEAQRQIDTAAGPATVIDSWHAASRNALDAHHRLDATRRSLETTRGHLPGAEYRLTAAHRELDAVKQRRFLRRPDPERLATARASVEHCGDDLVHLHERVEELEHAAQKWATEAAGRDVGAEVARIAYVHHRTWLTTHPTETQHLQDLDKCITDRTRHLGEHARTEPPAHVVRLIGPPDTSDDLQAWQRAAAKIEAYREQWQIPSSELGRQPELRSVQARQWQRVEIAVTDAIAPPIAREAGMDLSL